MKDEILKILKEEFKIHPLRVHNIYLYGSRCYGTYNENSDYDFIVVANNSVENLECTHGDFNFHIQTPTYFQSRLDWNDPKDFECLLWSEDNPILEKKEFNMEVVKPKLRHSVSHISSNSWVKGRKKIEQGDFYIGQKSVFHSLRIPMYGIQILKDGEITDWECANKYWEDIQTITDWEEMKDKYHPIRNKIMTEFRSLCPKNS